MSPQIWYLVSLIHTLHHFELKSESKTEKLKFCHIRPEGLIKLGESVSLEHQNVILP
jgi:hypothetical protein